MSDFAKIAGMIRDIKFAMLVVSTDENHLHAWPMTTQQEEGSQNIWFIGDKRTEMVASIGKRPQVNLSYSDTGKSLYVSITGKAELIDDQAKLDQLWSPAYEAFFEQGKSDPNIQLIKVTAQGAEYWEGDGKILSAIKMATAAVTGATQSLGKHEKVNL